MDRNTIALAAAYFAWRANHKSDDANEIARRALALTEAEHEQLQRDRQARARLIVSAHVVMLDPTDDGVIRLGGSHGTLRIEIVISKEGERDTGRGNVEVALPEYVSDLSTRWTDPSGRDLSDYPQRAARVGNANLLMRSLDGVALGVPERICSRCRWSCRKATR